MMPFELVMPGLAPQMLAAKGGNSAKWLFLPSFE